MKDGESSPAKVLRLLQLGDTWLYSVEGTLTPPGASPLPLSGQIEVSIVPDRLAKRSDWMTILFAQQFDLKQPDGSTQRMPAPEWMFSFIQDSETRDLSIAADNMTPNGSPRTAKTPQVFYPGTWSAQTAYNNQLDFDSGDWVKNTLTVLGHEPVETGVGSFLSWKSTISSESPATGLIEGADWWTPELGAPAKFSTVSKMPDGAQMRFTATLKSTNVQQP